ncbi:MAG: prolipoprotein diacylglyceryl transferase [Oscillospiraceae bacterium]|jgi:phosphatidylglycerol:prolipoprotein diacylglycerol transferase|nr:prolipoprotein diacylglyceryl transferase [Oscillospiraceae bacterium]
MSVLLRAAAGRPEISFPLLGGTPRDVPDSVSLFGFPIYFYGLFIALGYMLAALYVSRRRRGFGLTNENVLDILILVVAAGIVGARLYYVAFAWKDYFAGAGFAEIFNIRGGGLAIYGGLIGGFAALVIYAKVKKLSLPRTLDALGIAVPIGQAVGRWGNFVNREAFGGETTLPWRMGLHYASGAAQYVHPAFLYESLWNAAGALLLHIYSKRRKKRVDGVIFLMYAAWYGLGRFMIEGLRTDSLYLGSVRISQLVAAACFLGGSAAVLALLYGKRGKSSEVSAIPEERSGGENDISTVPDEPGEPEQSEESE